MNHNPIRGDGGKYTSQNPRVMTPFEEWSRIMTDVEQEQGTSNPLRIEGALARQVLCEREESRKLSAIVRKLTERCRELENALNPPVNAIENGK